MNINDYIKEWANICESEDKTVENDDISEKYISYVLTKNNLLDTVRYYDRKAEYYVDRRLGQTSRAMHNDEMLQKAEEKYDNFINSPKNKKINEDFLNSANSIIGEKFPELGEIKRITIINARESNKTKFFIFGMQNDKFLVMYTNFEFVDAVFDSKDEAVAKTRES